MKHIAAITISTLLGLFALPAHAEYGTWDFYTVYATEDCKGMDTQYAPDKASRNSFLSGGYWKSYVGRNVNGEGSPCVNVVRGIYILNRNCNICVPNDIAAVEAFAKQKVFEAYACDPSGLPRCQMTAGLNAEDGGFFMPIYQVEVRIRDWNNCFETHYSVTLETRPEEQWRDSEDYVLNTYVAAPTTEHCSGPMALCGGFGDDN